VIDATVVGSGPNGLAAAITLARAGLEVCVVEGAPTLGGGLRTAELTLPGFHHDVCSAGHPMVLASPFFHLFGLTERVPFVIPDVSYAHPLDDGPSGVAYRDLERTVDALGRDGHAWRNLFGPLTERINGVTDFTGNQLMRWPKDPIAAVRYGLRTLEQGTRRGQARFRQPRAAALFAGVMAHSIGPMPSLTSAGTGLLLGAHAHAVGWGFPVGGSQTIANALADDLLTHGGRIVLNHPVRSPADLDSSRITMLDTSPEFLSTFAGNRLPERYRCCLSRFRRGNGIAKVDFALSEQVPWCDPAIREAPTVHVGGTFEQIAASENAVAAGRVTEHPFVLAVQPTVLDPSRAPAGCHTLWTYIHVPHGHELDVTELITRQVERFAPGFRETILASTSMTSKDVATANPNNIDGDILGGAITLTQMVKRPVLSTRPWRTPANGLYLCSASTPPGPAVHGMNGWHAARLALKDHFGITSPKLT
jgi:phytoene dehydrogenase-like protein